MVELRDAAPADAHGIAVVQVKTWRAAYHGLLPDDVLANLSVPDSERRWSETLAAELPRARVVVATAASVVVGFAACGPPVDPSDAADPTLGGLYALYLDPGHWGRGIGTQMHAAVLERLRSCGFTHAGLWVLAGNVRALRFYVRHGWTDTGRTQIEAGPGGVELHERRLQRPTLAPS